MPMNIAFFASHGGSNMQAIIDACKSGKIAATPAVVVSNNRESQALKRANQEGIACYHLSEQSTGSEDNLVSSILEVLNKHKIDLIVLAGYMRKIGAGILEAYKGRIINIHPALLPKFGGQGMYGAKVHAAVIAAGEKESGATVHVVDGEYDHGATLAQAKVQVEDGDTVETLAARVLAAEHKLYVDTIARIAEGKIKLPL